MLTKKQTEAHLAWAVHGRKSQGRAFSSIRKRPPRDKEYRAWICSLPCAACGVPGRSEAAHTGSDGGMSMKASDYTCVPLCTDCHTQAPGAYHRIGKRAFERAHGISFAELAKRLTREWCEKCA